MKAFYITASFLLSGVSARTFYVNNNCSYTIWPALFTDPTSPDKPDYVTGWEAASGTSVNFTVPDDWKSGRVWGRRDCNFTTNPGPNSCATGGCNGGLLCADVGGTGVPPATVAEWTLQGAGFLDYYDVSVVDGFDLPVRIDNSVGCPVADCPVDLDPICPSQLQGAKNSSGSVLGCNSACNANLDGTPQNSANCCTGSHAVPGGCPNSTVDYYSFFKGNCPNSYAYAYDESSGTALWACSSGLRADYAVTFCP